MSNALKQLYEFGDFRLDAENGELWRAGEAVTLPRKAFDALQALVTRRGQLLTKDELMAQLWPDSFVEEASLTQLVYLLRKALSEGSEGGEGKAGHEDGRKWIVTVPGRGYRFMAEVRLIQVESQPLIIEEHAVTRIVITADELPETAPPLLETLPPLALPPAASGQTRRALWLTGALLLALVGFGFGAYQWNARRQARLATAAVRIKPLTNYVGSESEPAFSPDGKQCAFVWEGEDGANQDIYVKLVGLGPALRLTSDAGYDHSPVWSPDGAQIAFLRRRGATEELRLISALGGAESKLTEVALNVGMTKGLPSGLDWSPDGQWLALIEAPSGALSSVFLFSLKTGEKRRVTSPTAPSFGDKRPAFAPDGKTLAFARSTSSNVDNLFLVTLDGSQPERQLTDNRGPIFDLAWLPTGLSPAGLSEDAALLFTMTTDGKTGLWRITAIGGAPERVTTLEGEAYDLALARLPASGLLAYTRHTQTGNIWRLALDGAQVKTEPVRFIASSRRDERPQYSPDGQHIAFMSERSGNWEIWLCDATGRNATQLTNFNGPLAGSPRWSPDSQWIVFDARPAGQSDLFVISVNGGQPRQLTTDPAAETVPSWSRDGQWIFFCSNRSGERQLWKMPATGGAATQLTQGGAFESIAATDGQTLYYAKRGVNGIFTVPVTGGAEQPVPELQDVGADRGWMLSDTALYFIARAIGTAPTLKRFDLATRRIELVAMLTGSQLGGEVGLSIAADGSSLLYTQLDRTGGDILLVENFR